MDGEKELVLGNKQLISFFFVVLALCGVFFALGYMIGKNSGKVLVAGVGAGVDGTPAAPAAAETRRTEESEPPRETTLEQQPPPLHTEAPAETAAAPEIITRAAPQTQPAHDTPEPVAPPSQLAVPEPGAMYLQVRALRRPDAETLVKTLREQGYPAVLATSPKPELFRVLVGPYHETAQLADTKAKLKTLGFADAFVLR